MTDVEDDDANPMADQADAVPPVGLVDGVGQIEPPQYLVELRDHLQSTEPELWAWFVESTTRADDANDATAELDLLKSAIRLTGGPHAAATAEATLVADRLGLADGVELYQALDDAGRNARVLQFGGKIHIVFSGDLLELLDDKELRVVLAHELAHIALWRLEGGDFRVLDAMVHRLADESTAEPVAESARRTRLHTEVWADRIALSIVDDLSTTAATLIKTASGLRHVDPDAYLRQAERILAEDPSASTGWTHPEHHIRAACLALRATGVDRADHVARLVEGPDDLDRVDLLGQLRLQQLTNEVLAGGVSCLDAQALDDGTAAYLGNYPSGVPDDAAATDARPPDDARLARAEPSVRHLAAALLVDLALTDDALGSLAPLRSLSAEADRIGVATEFDKILAKATQRTVAEARRLRDPEHAP